MSPLETSCALCEHKCICHMPTVVRMNSRFVSNFLRAQYLTTSTNGCDGTVPCDSRTVLCELIQDDLRDTSVSTNISDSLQSFLEIHPDKRPQPHCQHVETICQAENVNRLSNTTTN